MMNPGTSLCVAVALSDGAVGGPGEPRSLNGYTGVVPLEPPAARQARHERVAARRAGPVIICHRGASDLAPENTLEGYTAAIDYGADGCEIDLRGTADGVLVLFHDDMLDRLTDGFGTLPQVTYSELLALPPPPLFAAPPPE